MVYFDINTSCKKIIKVLLIFILIIASHASVKAQARVKEAKEDEPIIKNKVDTVAAAGTSINFVLWFMATKQEPIINTPIESTNLKKQMIISRRAPNRLLMRAFLKKATNLHSMIS